MRHCGCMLVGELRKARYVYYHCTGNRGPAQAHGARKPSLRLGDVVDTIRIEVDVFDWLKNALQSSFEDEVAFHTTAVARLRERYDRLQSRLDAMYVDKLDGKITEAFYEAKVAEWRAVPPTRPPTAAISTKASSY